MESISKSSEEVASVKEEESISDSGEVALVKFVSCWMFVWLSYFRRLMSQLASLSVSPRVIDVL